MFGFRSLCLVTATVFAGIGIAVVGPDPRPRVESHGSAAHSPGPGPFLIACPVSHWSSRGWLWMSTIPRFSWVPPCRWAGVIFKPLCCPLGTVVEAGV